MKKIITEYYNLDSEKVLKPITLAIISDIHLSDINYKDITKDVEEVLKKEKIDYILMPGDFFKGFPPKRCLLNKNNKDMLLHLLNTIKKYAPIIMSLGNHDVRYMPSIKEYITFSRKFKYYDEKLRAEFRSLKSENIYPLDNESIVLDNIFFAGFYQRAEAYAVGRILKSKVLKIIEDLNKVKEKINPSKDKYSILLHHQADTLFNKKIQKEIKYIYNYDLCVLGHEHNGKMPISRELKITKVSDFLVKTFKGKKDGKLYNLRYWGNVESPLNLFIKNYCRGMHHINGTTLIISKGMPRSRNGGRNDDVIEIVNIVQKQK